MCRIAVTDGYLILSGAYIIHHFLLLNYYRNEFMSPLKVGRHFCFLCLHSGGKGVVVDAMKVGCGVEYCSYFGCEIL